MAAYSSRKINALLAALDGTTNPDAKGAALEELSRYVFERVAGVKCVDRNILDGPRAHELDLAFWIDQPRSLLHFLEAVLIVECKATETAVGSHEVGWFVRKLQVRGARHGVLVALSGITGKADGISSARSEILDAQTKDGIKILLLTREDISTLTDTKALSENLRRQFLALTLRRVVDIAKE
jgi:hypothetical protein